MSLVIDALDAPFADRAHVLCVSDGSRPRTLSELGRDARLAASWLQNLGGCGGTVAALLTASHDCLANFFGALRSGQTLVSLPHPARGMDAAEYLAQVNLMSAQTGATHLLCDPTLAALLAEAAVPVHAFGEYHSRATAVPPLAPGQFVQFTSGSTGRPRGIALSLDALDANFARCTTGSTAWRCGRLQLATALPRHGPDRPRPLRHLLGEPPLVGSNGSGPDDARVVLGRPVQLATRLYGLPSHVDDLSTLCTALSRTSASGR